MPRTWLRAGAIQGPPEDAGVLQDVLATGKRLQSAPSLPPIRPTMRQVRLQLSLFAALLFGVIPSAFAQDSVPLVGGPPAVQAFDSLAAAGTGSTLPGGWAFLETGTNANSTYAADTGAANSGNTYSYGASASSERAFGMLRSGSLVPMIGARLRNDSGNALSAIAVAYTGEQWRLGTAGRVDRLDFQYSLDATSLGDAAATWVDVDTLDFTSPVNGGAVGALDGNLAANRRAVSGSITGIVLPVGVGIWVRWLDLDASGADDGLAIDDASFAVSGDPPPDIAPTVTATTPANNAIDVPLAATLAISFSEPVALGEPWFSLACSVSGAHAAAVSGGPTAYTITPSPAFVADESCTWTILASSVTDLDGLPHTLAANHVVTFTTLDPANLPAPTLVSSVPANGATNVPRASDVRLSFSEPVTTSPNAFTLQCDGSPVVLGESGTGAQRTLTPAGLLPASAACVFTIDGALVRNAADIALVGTPTISFSVTAGGTGNYYSQVNASSMPQLRCTLHATIRGHTAYPYSGSGTTTWTILETAQAMPGNPAKVIDVYRNRAYNAVSDRAGTGSGLTYNREHTWPNSLGFPGLTGNLGLPNAPYTDTHMLWLSDTQWNSDRGNKPFANCPTGCGERITELNGGVGGGSGVYPGNSNWVRTPDGNLGSFETWNHRKGEMARAIFYMAIRYEGGVDPVSGQQEPQLELTDTRAQIVQVNNYAQTAYMGLLADLLAWHAADPPDAEEIARNNVIQTFQGNRNPFVDHPEWATRALFESTTPTVCVLNDVIFAHGFEAVAP